MHTANLIKGYKSPYTPMNYMGSTKLLYKRKIKETRFEESNDKFVFADIINYEKTPFLNETVYTLNLEKKDRAFLEFYSDFINKWGNYKSIFFEFQEIFVFENIKLVIDNFLLLNPTYLKFELTNDCSVYFQSSINEKNVYLELYFTKDLEEGVEAISNVYEDGECILAYGGTIENTFSKIFTKTLQVFWLQSTPKSSHEISEQAFAQSQF